MPCLGNREDHCCWVKGVPCAELRENDPRAPERRWACGIYLDLGDWDAVIASDRYTAATNHWDGTGMNCKDWPNGVGINNWLCDNPGCNI